MQVYIRESKVLFFCNLRMVDIIVGTSLVLWEKWSGCPGNRRKVCYRWSCRQRQLGHDRRVGSHRGRRRRKAAGGTEGREGETGGGTNPAGTGHLSGEGVRMYVLRVRIGFTWHSRFEWKVFLYFKIDFYKKMLTTIMNLPLDLFQVMLF